MLADQTFRSIPRMAQLSAERFGCDEAIVEGEARLTFQVLADEMLRLGRVQRVEMRER